jgi:amino acid permease
MLKDERPVVLEQGIYKPVATTSEAVFMITGLTIGAGVLAVPYAVAEVGMWVGLAYIAVLGLVTLGINLLLGEVAVRTKEPLQIPGFAGKYLGPWAKRLVSFTIVLRSYGAILAYMIGAGIALSALFGGQPEMWSILFWSIGITLVWKGLNRVKVADKIMSLAVMVIIGGISFYLLPEVAPENAVALNPSHWLAPIGVILFALSATPAVAEAHALLPNSEKRFRTALTLGTIIPTLLYILFAYAVVGTLGHTVTGIASVGLGERYGQGMLFFANLFAVLAMSTAFMGLGTALKQTFIWDHKLPPLGATFLVAAVPLILFLLGVRQFVTILELIGGVFIGIENTIMVLVYLKARHDGTIAPRSYKLSHAHAISAVLGLFFVAVAAFSLIDSLHRII